MRNPNVRAPDPASGLRSLGQQAVEEVYRELFQNAHDGEYVLDVATDRFLMVNDAFARMTGYPRETLCSPGFTSLSIIAPEHHDQVLKRRQNLGAETYAVRILTAAKEARDLEVSVRRLDFHNRMVTLGTARDVTERMRAQEALRESEARLRLLVEQMPAILWTTDKALLITSSIGAGLPGLGLAPGQLNGTKLTDYLKSTDPAIQPLDAHYRALKGEPVTYDMDWSGRSFHTFIGPLRHQDGSIHGCIGLSLDITERKRAEETLRESEEQFRRLSEATTEGIALHEGPRIIYVNKIMAAMFGYDPHELVGKNVLDVVAPESHAQVAKRIETLDESPCELVGLRKDGSTFPYEVRGKIMPYKGRTVRVVTLRDISAVKQMSASLERQVRLEKKKTLEAFQANVRIFQLTEKIRAAYESTTHLVNSRDVQELLGSAVALLCDPAGLDYREAMIYLSREGGLELLASHPEHAPVCIPHDADHPVARAARGGAPQPDSGGLVLPLKGQAGTVGVLEVRFHNAEEVRSWQENILRTLANSLSLMVDNLNLYEMVRRQSITDVLTGVHNRRYFDEKLGAEVERAVRYKREMALVMIDLDDFKQVNDDPRGGHMQGDDVLREIGAILRKQSRQIDMICRYGGDEFTLILPETGLANAVRHADRLREIIAAKVFVNRLDPQRPFRLTASIGVAEVDAQCGTPEAVLAAADKGAFLAKREGKNRVKSSKDL